MTDKDTSANQIRWENLLAASREDFLRFAAREINELQLLGVLPEPVVMMAGERLVAGNGNFGHGNVLGMIREVLRDIRESRQRSADGLKKLGVAVPDEVRLWREASGSAMLPAAIAADR